MQSISVCQKYHDLQSNYHLQPVAIETTGVYGMSTAPFLSGLTKKLVGVSGTLFQLQKQVRRAENNVSTCTICES